MRVIDHGKWIRYRPEKFPEGAPINALFAKRESDGVDWYDYVNSGDNFQADSVKIAAMYQDAHKAFVIGPSVLDPTLIFPAGQIVREFIGFPHNGDEEAVIAAFRNKYIDPDSNDIVDPPPLPPPPDLEAELRQMLARLEALEAKVDKWFEDNAPRTLQ